MTQPMTPREKVAGAIESYAMDMGDIIGNPYGYADAILAALASGSGEAELARLAERCDLIAESSEPHDPEWFDSSDHVCAKAATGLRALIAEIAALRSERDRAEGRIRDLAAMFGVCDGGRYLNDWKVHCDRATEAERKLAEAVADERERGQVIINERDKWIAELIRDRNKATDLLQAAISEAVPDAMIFAGHVKESRYTKAMDDLRAWTRSVRTFLSSTEAERG